MKGGNRLLAALSAEEFERWAPALEPVELKLEDANCPAWFELGHVNCFVVTSLTASPRWRTPMKVLTCRELGGPCEQKLSAQTWAEMVKTMTQHVMEKHPDTAKAMEKMHNEDPKKWGREMKPKWDANADS